MPDENSHLVHIGPHGSFSASGKLNSTPASIDSLFTSMQQNNCKHMLMYFHGGLVPEDSAVSAANHLVPLFSAAGIQPVFFIWETGPWETIRQNLPKILNSKIVKELLMFALSQVAKRWGIDIPGKGPGETMSHDEIAAEMAKPVPFENWDIQGGAKGGAAPLDEADLAETEKEMELELSFQMQARSDQLEEGLAAAADNPLLSTDMRAAGSDLDAKGLELLWLVKIAASAAVQVLRRYINKQDHGLYPTTVEEILRAANLDGIGKFLWDAMKEKAAEMWLPNPDVLPANFTDAHAGSYFLDHLAAYAQSTAGFQVDLVGHSAGSIVICELLKSAAQRHPGFHFSRIALMAPAARMDLFVSEIISHPERFDALRVFIMKESIEMKDAIAGKAYPLSLLYFVSGVLENPSATPISGLECSLTGLGPNSQGDALAAHNFLYMPAKDRLVLSITADSALPGLRSNAEHHGEFDNPSMSSGIPGETLKSLQVYFQR